MHSPTKPTVLTDDYTQKILQSAMDRLSVSLSERGTAGQSKLALLHALFCCAQEYSSSGNSVPNYRGLGIEETLELAEMVVHQERIEENSLHLFGFQNIAESFSTTRGR